jgi:ubiquinone biosynthesis protein Coq4
MVFLPKYEHHDALHVLLGYDTTVLGEARLQAFMVGNRTPTFAGKSLHILAQLLLPEDRDLLARDRLRGSKSSPIDWLSVEHKLRRELDDVRESWMIEPQLPS